MLAKLAYLRIVRIFISLHHLMDLNHIPLRKQHHIDLTDVNGQTIYRLSFLQASFGETIEFIQKDENEITQRFLKLMQDNGKYMGKYSKTEQHVVDQLLAQNMSSFISQASEKMHKGRESMYTGITKALAKGEKKRKGILPANVQTLIKEWNIGGLNDLLDNYTYEQYGRMQDALTFNSYEMTKEGMQANDKLFTSDWLTEDQQKIIDFYKDFPY